MAVPVPFFFPKFIRLPSVAKAAAFALHGANDEWHTRQSVDFARSASRSQQWWQLQQSGADVSPFGNATGLYAGSGLQVVVASDKIAGGVLSSSVAAGGVLAFYAVIVYGIHRVTRAFFGGARYRLQVDELPDTRDLIDLLEGIYIARRDGDLMRETELYEVPHLLTGRATAP